MKFKMQSLTEVWNESKLYLMGFVALFGIVFGSVFTYQNVIKPITSTVSVSTVKADEDKGMSYSFYDMSAWLSAYYNAATSPTGYESLEAASGDQKGKALLTDTAVRGAKAAGKNEWGLATPTWISSKKIGGGGSLLGFPDKEVVDGGIFGYLASKTSSSTTDYSYSSLATRQLKEDQYYNSLETYAYYGASLSSLGIDTNLGGGLMGWHPIRMIGGALIWVFYIIVSFSEKIFALAIAILKMTNPFALFSTAMDYKWFSGGDLGVLSGLANFVSSTYKIFSSFGWVIMIPVIVSMLIFMLIFTGGGRQNPQLDQRRRSKFRYGIIYFFFLAVGVPFLGTAYTAGLDAMSESVNSGSFSVNSVILSTYVNNKAWIEENRMYLPDSAVIEWDLDDSDVTATSKAAVRRTALAINALNNDDAANAITASDQSNWNIQQTYNPNNMSKSISAMLLAYMMGDKYEPSNWETNVKAQLTKLSNDNSDITNNITAGALELTKGYAYLGYVNANIDGDSNAGVEVDDSWWPFSGTRNVGGTINMFLNKGYADEGNGGIIAQDDGTSIVHLKRNPAVTSVTPGFDLPEGNGGSAKATMSYLEMYNYLNSTFTANKVRVYSTNALASNFTRDSHAEVNQVGSGLIHKFLIWINTIVMLLGLGIIVIGYAFGIIIGAFRRYMDIINSIFLGTLGFQKGMVRATAGTIMLIAETLGTLVIYELAKTVYIGVPSIVEGAFAKIGTNGINGTSIPNFGFMIASTNFFGFVSIIFALIISTILLAWMSLMLLRIRKPILDIMDTTFTGLINKLFYGDGQVPGDAPTGVNPNNNGGMIGDVAAVGAGAGLGALNSNVDGAEGNDGEDGWSDSGTAASGEATADSNLDDTDGPDARVASSRDTEETGAEIAESGKLNRASSAQPDGVNGIGDSAEDADQDSKDMAQSAQNSANKAVNAANAVSGISSQSSQSENDTDQSESEVGANNDAPVSISDDDTVSINASSSSASGGLAPDGVEAPISATSSAKSSIEDNDTVEASNVIPFGEASKRLAAKNGDEAAVTAGAVASANAQSKQAGQNSNQQSQSESGLDVGESAQIAQTVAQAQAAKALVRASTGQTESAPSAQGQAGSQSASEHAVQAGASAQSMDSVGASVAAGVQQAQQLMQQSDQLQAQANQIMAQASNPQSGLSNAQRSQKMAQAQQMMDQAVGLEAQAGQVLSGVKAQQMQSVAQSMGQQQMQGAYGGQSGYGSQIGGQGSQQVVSTGSQSRSGVAPSQGAMNVRSLGSQFVQAATNATLAGAGLPERQVASSSSSGTIGQTQRSQVQTTQTQTPSGSMQRQTSQTTNSVGNSSMRQAGQNLRQAGQSAQSSVRNGAKGVTQSATGVGNVATGVGRAMSGDLGGAQQAMQGAGQLKQGLRQTAQSTRQAVNAAGNLGRAAMNVGQAGIDRTQDVANKATDVAQRVANSTAGRVVGGVATTGAKVLNPVGNHIARETARVWSETASLSGSTQQDANSNYYYDQLDDRRNTTRQSAHSYEPRQTSQRERTDARIRRTKRPN